MKKSNGNAAAFISKERFDSLWSIALKHPFLIAAAVCMLATGLGYQSQYLLKYFIETMAVCFIGLCLFRCIRRILDERRSKALAVGVFLLEVVLSILAVRLYLNHQNRAELVYVAGTMLVAIVTILLLLSLYNEGKDYRRKIAVIALFMQGFIMRFGYVLETSILRRQNDVHKFGEKDGHAAYIEYLLNNRSLPDFDPTTVWQFYHPPFHHSICAVWLKILGTVGIPYDVACESIQAVSLFCSLSIMILFYKLARHIRLNGMALYVPLLIVFFHPSQFILSGNINNDVMSIAFILGAIYTTAVWYKEPCINNILKIAFCIGLGMMTKLSAGLVAPAVAIVFLVALIKYRKRAKSLIGQFALFGVVCVPLGLWWGIRNYILFKTPLTYVPSLSIISYQYIGRIPFKDRLFDFSSYQFSYVFEQWTKDTYREFNPTIAFLKNSLFGEHLKALTFEGNLIKFPTVLFWVAMALAVLGFVSMLVCLFKKGGNTEKLLLTVTSLVLLFSYYKFCYEYPFICTMNFRYIVPCLYAGAVSLGFMLKYFKDAKSKPVHAVGILCRASVGLATAVFCICSYMTYFVVISSFS